MAWAEAALEELGLAQIWVRRGGPPGDREATVARVVDAPENATPPAASPNVDAEALEVDTAAPREASDAREASDVRDAREVGEVGEVPDAAPSALRAPRTESEPALEDDYGWFDAPLPADTAPRVDTVPLVDARDAAPSIAELDWDTLAARVADCTRCRLCEKRTNTVFGVGDRHADWMLIGEAPGENEDKQGEPFVGQAGKLLDNMLQALSLKRGENVYIANVIKCRPPGNRNPEPDEVARCSPYLQRQVALVKPKLIVALGRFAAQTLLNSDSSIASMRGRVHEYEGVPVVVSYHPAYLLRSLQDKSKAWADLCLARDTFREAASRGAAGSAAAGSEVAGSEVAGSEAAGSDASDPPDDAARR
ncbi:uracil-DNA glycosylase [Burkholderia guangdongensis]|uniref:uracil-DNA glycosylase n=1 Tax=Burkholderia guangdongensis TaxID=1792500 RepID=UPI0015CE2B24|nr:uracil-DNA glycosylase [Burkholderia guangdongensis]